jgi:long-chain acyl-CoA synthetase
MVEAQDDTIGCAVAVTLPGLFRERAARTPHRTAYRQFDAKTGRWRRYTWQSMAKRVARFAHALAQSGATAGDRVALLLPNCIDWVAFDIAALSLGLVVVPLYAHDSPANTAQILAHSDARLALLDTAERSAALAELKSTFPGLDQVWVREGGGVSRAGDRPGAIQLDAVLPVEAAEPPARALDPEAVATLIYTSGTTGVPKGVMLSHRAVLWNAEVAASYTPPGPDDVFLSVLPLAHAFERTLGYYAPMMSGSTVAYARSVRDLPDDLLTIRPTFLLGVPRLYERVCATINEAAEANPLKRRLIALTASLGWAQFESSHGRAKGLGPLSRALRHVLDRLVARRILASFGGRLRVAVSGGAGLPMEVAQLLIGMGLPLVEGYGLTEAAPVVTGTTLDDYLPGSVGRALRGIELKVGAESELLARTPAVMKGYWKDPNASAQAVDDAGWLHTGDIADILDGRVYIRGRLKDILVLSSGEKINPNLIEAEIGKDPLELQEVVVGEGRPFPVAVIAINDAAFRSVAAEHGLDPQDLEHPDCKSLVLEPISRRLRDFPSHARPRALHLTRDAWTIEAGLQTPTLKVKRRMVEQRYATAIAGLYAGGQG